METGRCNSPLDIIVVCCTNFYQTNNACRPCPPGSYGRNCSLTCPQGWFGSECKYSCDCQLSDCYPTYGCVMTTTSIASSYPSTLDLRDASQDLTTASYLEVSDSSYLRSATTSILYTNPGLSVSQPNYYSVIVIVTVSVVVVLLITILFAILFRKIIMLQNRNNMISQEVVALKMTSVNDNNVYDQFREDISASENSEQKSNVYDVIDENKTSQNNIDNYLDLKRHQGTNCYHFMQVSSPDIQFATEDESEYLDPVSDAGVSNAYIDVIA
ncbi:uncharacterized protein LOC134262559 [Saccostrea cucullata]|uniref:uncharacterized protein LOC134262559 n=1 Tax=Saccostrea cuccullata TaxID=36930 RepID=UPI002ED253F4